MNTPAFTNLLGIRVRVAKVVGYLGAVEGVVMAVSYADAFAAALPFGAAVPTLEYRASGFVLLILTDDQRLRTVAVDGKGPNVTVLG